MASTEENPQEVVAASEPEEQQPNEDAENVDVEPEEENASNPEATENVEKPEDNGENVADEAENNEDGGLEYPPETSVPEETAESASVVTDGVTVVNPVNVEGQEEEDQEAVAGDGDEADVEEQPTEASEESKDVVETMASEDLTKGEGEDEKPSDEVDAGEGQEDKPEQDEGVPVEPADPEAEEAPVEEDPDKLQFADGPPERLDTHSPTDVMFGRGETGDEETVGVKMAEDEVEDDEDISMTEKIPDRESLIEFYQQAMKDREALAQENTTLQNKLSEYFRRKRTEEGGPTGAATNRGDQVDRSVSDLEQRYLSFMTNLEELQSKQRESKDNYEREIAAIKEQCVQKETELQRMTSEFVERRRQIALTAINSRTGKPLQREEVEQYIQNEQKKDQEVKAVRLENIKLKNRLQKREKQLKQKEELAEGLHLIDFEQLKIENQTYNEKIEERNEELSKLRKKITNTVEVLTHLKEKLQYITQENGQLNQQLEGLDKQVAQKRDSLTRIKQNRDKLRNENHELNRQCGLLGNETLLRDYEEKYSESSDLKNRLSELKGRHSELSMKCTGYKKKIENARAGLMIN